MNFVMWVKAFFEQQVMNLHAKSIIRKLWAKPSVLQQDNNSSICLEANGKRSSTKRTWHINIRYFYVTNKIKSGDVVIVYHPTGKLVRDYLTKPLNGTPFKNHRTTIMGVDNKSNTTEWNMKMLKSNIKNIWRIKDSLHPNQASRWWNRM